MRMWNINPKLMCRKHLMGEHVEMHMLVGSLNKGRSIDGFLRNNLIEVHNIEKRHEELVEEIISRGYNHNSPLPLYKKFKVGKVNIKENIKDLVNRCPDCKKLINK